jgi:hypothetical protein
MRENPSSDKSSEERSEETLQLEITQRSEQSKVKYDSTTSYKNGLEKEPETERRLKLHLLDSIINADDDFPFSPQTLKPSLHWIDSLITTEPQTGPSETNSR